MYAKNKTRSLMKERVLFFKEVSFKNRKLN